MPTLPISKVPGHVDVQSKAELEKNIKTVTVDMVIKALTVQPAVTKQPVEPGPEDIMFAGTFEQVNRFFYENEWSDGLPIIPPTIEKVREFLKFTDRSPDEVIGVLLPETRQATIWNIAVNGVMAGCRPEYMPVLIALTEAMADPKYGVEHSGNTPKSETLITINGPITKDLNFNYEQGVIVSVSGTKAEEVLPYISEQIVGHIGWELMFTASPGMGCTQKPHLLLSPVLTATIAKSGWSKKNVEQYLYDHARPTRHAGCRVILGGDSGYIIPIFTCFI
jgi:hypothetical protein